jgi:hypothetical protein
MKSNIQKEMRKIRVKLKLHDITEEQKLFLRKELENLRIKYDEEKIKMSK